MTTDRNKQIDQIARNCESLSEKDRASVVRLLEEGFHDQAACALFDEGIAEERVFGTCPDPSAGSNLRFIPSALQDLEAFVTSTGKSRLRAALLSLPKKLNTSSCVRLPRENARLLRVGSYRIVFRFEIEPQRFVVLGITPWWCNPMLKVWRYLDHFEAEDFIRKSELYFRRADLLEDQYEVTPTLSEYLDERAVFQQAFGRTPARGEMLAEAHKSCSYVCCWRKDCHESWLAWKQYCPQSDGFAVQTTWRKLIHLHGQLRRDFDVWCKSVEYLDHRGAEFPRPGLEEKAFCKALWFSDEREIRLAHFGEKCELRRKALEANPDQSPECHRIVCDLHSLVDALIINPFATDLQRTSIKNVIAEHRPCLLPRIRSSEILRRPIGAAG